MEEPGEGGGAGLGITLLTGILYVADPVLLKSGKFVVERGNSTTTTTTIVNLEVLESKDPELVERCRHKVYLDFSVPLHFVCMQDCVCLSASACFKSKII